MIVRELISRFGVQVDKQGFKKADDSFKKIAMAAKAFVGVLVAGKVTSVLKGVAEQTAALADDIDKTSKRIGISVQALQEMRLVAGLAGASNQSLSVALRMLAKNADEAASGSKEYADEFKRLGIEVRDTSGTLKSSEELLTEMADSFVALESDTERTAVAQKLLGRSGSELIPLLIQGSAAIADQRKEAKQLGILDQELIDLGVDYTDTSLRLNTALQGVRNAIAKALLPAMIAIKKAFVDWFKANGAILRQNLTAFFKRAAEFTGRFVRAIVDLVQFTWSGYEAMSAFGKIAIGVLTAIAAWMLIPQLPLLLFLALVALIIDDFLAWREGGASLFGALVEWLEGLTGPLGIVRELFVALWDAVKWAFDMIINTIGTFLSFFVDIFTVGISEAWNNLWQRLWTIFGDWMDAFKNFWTPIIDFWKGLLLGFVNWVKEGVVGTISDLIGGFKAFFGKRELKAVQEFRQEAARPAMAAPGPGGGTSIVSTPETKMDIQVNAAPGMDVQQVASAVAKQVQEANEVTYRKAALAFTAAK